jgi:ribosomal protein S18 acetylase RimI-like enzyme
MNATLPYETNSTHESRAVATLVTAFAADPAVRWMYPRAEQYLQYFPEFVRAFGGRAFEHGTASWLTGYQGAALWLAPDVQPDADAMGALLEQSVSEQRLPEVVSLLEQMSHFHPSHPHWYLPLVGVDPRMQQRGFGSGLLMLGLERCDREGLPAYLESTNQRNISLYERLGFQTLGRIRTETSPVVTPMIRHPR